MKLPEDVILQKQLTQAHIEEWLKDDVLKPQWWALIALILIFVVLWCVLVKKSRLLEISLYVGLAVVAFMGVNEYGEELTLWDYPTDVIAVFPPLSSINMVILPLLFSLVYQCFTNGRSFIIASLVASVVMSFIVDPILAACRLYELVHWKYYESIPVYFLVAVSVRAVVRKIYSILEEHRVNLRQSM